MQSLELDFRATEDLTAFWQRLAQQCQAWLAAQKLSARDAVLLLPFAQQIAPARRAWTAQGLWQPRITTSHSLASALGPAPLAQAGQISFDAAIDAFTADGLLADQSWAQALKRRDARAYGVALQRLVETAHQLAQASAQRRPAQRGAYFADARARLSAQTGGPGELETAMAQVALAWVESDERRPVTDTLFGLNPSAWLVLRVGGPDPLADALLAGSTPSLLIDAELDLDALNCPPERVEQAVCADFEALADASAAAVLQHLAAGRAPVALLAQDRVVVRRVRALLDRAGVPLHDETGWTLSTTPAAAAVMALLRAAQGGASVDEALAWLKSPLTRDWDGAAIDALEALCRRRGWREPIRLDALDLPVWRRARASLEALTGGPRGLGQWLTGLAQVLRGLAPLDELPGGTAVLDALWLSRSPWPDSAHAAVLAGTRLRPDEFLAWVDATLEAAQFKPDALDDGPAPVVITPMARALLRPFAAIVLPGADAGSLGAAAARSGLLSDGDAQALGLPCAAEQRQAQALAFAQLLRAPHVTLLRSARAGSEPLAASPLLERLEATLGRVLPAWQDERAVRPLSATPQPGAQAHPARLPASLSASGIEALRHCPYQFFGRVLLGLSDADELEAEPDKRDYGTWLHAVLGRFHEQGRSGDDPADLRAAAEVELALIDATDFLPFSAAFERVAPRYLAWLADAEAAGQHFAQAEVALTVQPFAAPLQDLTLKGRIDRIDTAGAGPVLLDYKTGSVRSLKDKLAQPLEDTQLAAYALLMERAPGLQAAYLALDDPKAIELLPHPEINQTALALRDGLQGDLLAMQAGAALPALGEGAACDFCEMRGLCRRDDWS